MVETRASQIAVLEKNMQKFQQQVDDHTGSIEGLHLKVDGLEAGVAEIRAMMQEVMKRLPVVEEPAVQTRQEEQSPNRVQANLGEQIPIAPREAHGVPLGAEVRNAMPMRPLNQDFRVRANQPRVGMQTGEFFENGQNEPILGEFGDPIEERRNVGNNARFMPPFQGHFDAPYEEPWLGRRQGRQHGHQGQQAQFEPHAAPPRHGMHFGDPREDQWGLNDQDEAWFDPRRGRPARERPRQFQGAHHRDPYWQEQDGPPWNQGRARDPRPMKLDFPRFKGGDPTAWVYRALQYFHYYQVLEPEKVMHASYHLDEEALVWFQDCEHELHGWNDFVRAIQIRFGPASYDDPMELLTKLKQTHNIAAYKSQFESTSNRVRELSDMHKLSCFMSGMKDEIRLAVKMQGPRNLGEAYALAKIQEEYLATVKRSTRPTYEPSRGSWVQSQAQQGAARVENKSGDSKQFSARPSMPVQRLTPMQMSERRKKGLCYNCDERWSSDHRCKNRKLYLMEEVEDEEAELIEIEEEEVEAELEDEKAEITLCALLGSTSPSTMRVIAILNGQKTVVLLDTGSTHNFMDGTLAKTLKLPIDVESNFGVRVANGQVIRTLGECKEVKFKMQGLHLKLTFNLLELGGCGIVLGTQWLSTLGVISWDFKNLVMGFMHEGKQVWLQGLKEKPNLIQGSKDFKGKATMKGLLLQIMPCELASIQEEICAPIRELVEEFPQVFEEPEGLPPKRNHEHQILLKEGQVWLQGLKEKPNLIQGSKDFKGKATMKGLLLQIMPCELASIQEEICAPIRELVEEFPQVFEEPEGLPPKRNHEHQILLKEGVPPHFQRPYRYPHYQKTEIEKIVQDLLDSGCVRPSQSPFASPVLLVRKADGSWRMCVDYRGLNKETVKDKFPIPVVDELLSLTSPNTKFNRSNCCCMACNTKDELSAKNVMQLMSHSYETS
uniref:Ty3 transposon capsid-like protein domain-containing protein n=1 Tax=Fagus sylvatica TaxID=28930 RepID=A0A2N9EMW0_FAGSY